MKLLPCPFCGSDNVKLNGRTTHGHGDSTSEVYVECQNCRAKGPDTGYWGSVEPEQGREAAHHWNVRMMAGIDPVKDGKATMGILIQRGGRVVFEAIAPFDRLRRLFYHADRKDLHAGNTQRISMYYEGGGLRGVVNQEALPQFSGEPQTLEEAVDFFLPHFAGAEDYISGNTKHTLNPHGKPMSKQDFRTFCHSMLSGGISMNIRNKLGLWRDEPKPPIYEHMQKRFNVTHPDDMSGIIVEHIYDRIVKDHKLDQA